MELICTNVIKDAKHITTVGGADGTTQAWKVALTSEWQLANDELPSVACPHRVCIKQRKSFLYTNTDGTLTWRYDFTLTWEGKSKSTAEAKQFSEEPVCEFEIELVYAHPDVSEIYIAESIIMKMMEHKWVVEDPRVLRSCAVGM